MVRHPNYHWHVVQPPGFNPERLPELIESAHKRLERVQIECLPYGEIFANFDSKDTLFYCDPPYFGKKLYRHNFTTADFEKFEERRIPSLSSSASPLINTLLQLQQGDRGGR